MEKFAEQVWTGLARCVLLLTVLLAPAGCCLPGGYHDGPDGEGNEVAPPAARFHPVPTAPVFGTKGVGDIPSIDILPPRTVPPPQPPAKLNPDPAAEESKAAPDDPTDAGEENRDAPDGSPAPSDDGKAGGEVAPPEDDEDAATGLPAVKDKTAHRTDRRHSIIRRPATATPASHTAPRKPPRRPSAAGGWRRR